jgi:hypothetical protein
VQLAIKSVDHATDTLAGVTTLLGFVNDSGVRAGTGLQGPRSAWMSAPAAQSAPQATRAYGANHRTGQGTCHRERPLAFIMSPRSPASPRARLIQLAFP